MELDTTVNGTYLSPEEGAALNIAKLTSWANRRVFEALIDERHGLVSTAAVVREHLGENLEDLVALPLPVRA